MQTKPVKVCFHLTALNQIKICTVSGSNRCIKYISCILRCSFLYHIAKPNADKPSVTSHWSCCLETTEPSYHQRTAAWKHCFDEDADAPSVKCYTTLEATCGLGMAALQPVHGEWFERHFKESLSVQLHLSLFSPAMSLKSGKYVAELNCNSHSSSKELFPSVFTAWQRKSNEMDSTNLCHPLHLIGSCCFHKAFLIQYNYSVHKNM